MTEAEFAEWGMTYAVGGLVAYMFYIIVRLAHASKGGKYAYIVLVLALGLGMFGFLAKGVIIDTLNL